MQKPDFSALCHFSLDFASVYSIPLILPEIHFHFSDKGQLHVDFRYSTFSRAVRKSVGENEEKLMTSSIKTALESAICFHEFPNYQLDVFILVLEDDGAVLSTSINAAGMALINASIPCYDMVSSSSAAVGSGGVLLDDPSTKEEETRLRSEENQGTCSVSSLSSIDQISNVLFKGFIDPTALKAAKNHLHELNKKRSLYLKTVVVSEMERGLREA